MLTTLLPCYLYVEYNDDVNLQAFFNAQNQCAQFYLDSMNALDLPIYTKAPVSGLLLDWVGLGLYGIQRPYLPAANTSGQLVGPYNTVVYNRMPYNSKGSVAQADYVPATDDIYRRVITWDFYKGDGKYFTIKWLKRRIARFLFGDNGIDPGIQETSDISVTFPMNNDVEITLDSTLPNATVFAQTVANGILQLPFQYNFTVTLV